MNKVILTFIYFLVTVSAYANTKNAYVTVNKAKNVFTDSNYIKEIQTWHQRRIEGLKAENGWLNLAGLFWLEEGVNTFGSDKTNKLVFPKGAAFMGRFILKNGEIIIETSLESQIKTLNNEAVQSLKVYPVEKDITLKSGSLRWFIIKRVNKYGIRLRDLESETLLHFKDIDTYPIEQKWRIKARFEASEWGKKIPITDVLGQTNMQPSPGTLVFMIDKIEYRLDAIEDGKQLFIIFKDATSGKDTYGAGRFLYTEKPNTVHRTPNGEVVVYLDFNKSINPPCAFTEFATCPLPPEQNWLSVAISAGEKKFGGH